MDPAKDVADPRERYVAEFERAGSRLPGSFLRRLRREAIDRFAERGFPTTDDEAWRFTDVSSISETPFRLAIEAPDTGLLAPFARGPLRECQITFVDGRFAPDFSTLQPRDGLVIGSLAHLLERDTGRLEPYLGRMGPSDGHPFAALNTAFFADGAFVQVRRGAAPERPIHVLFLTSRRPDPFVVHPRILLVLECGARATVVESFLGPVGGTAFTNAVTEAVLGENASLDFTLLQRESRDGFHVSVVHVRQERSSSLASHAISLGARLSRTDLGTVLDGEGAECALNGLYETAGRQHVDHHTTIDHAKPHGTSRELYKGILDGQSRGVFDGRIIVRPQAQKTNAMQTNRNLLLSKGALVHTKPQLEIFANDVKCKHGATIGQLDSDVLFYLRSRGIGLEEARRILVHAFASEIIDGVRVDAIRAQLAGCMALLVPGTGKVEA